MDKIVKKLLVGLLVLMVLAGVFPFLETGEVSAQEFPRREYYGPEWNDEVVNVVEYNDGTVGTYTDFNSIVWADVKRIGLRLLPSQEIGGFDVKRGFLLWYPSYGTYDKPALRGFIRFWGKTPSGWQKIFLAGDAISKTPIYEEIPYTYDHFGNLISAYTKEIGWSGVQTIGGQDVPFYVGLKADLLSRSFGIKTRVTTPVALENSAIEYVFVVNPELDITEKVKWVRIYLDTGEVQNIPIDQLVDKSGTLPSMLKYIAFVLSDGREIGFLNFEDVWNAGINGHWKINQITLPSGQTAWALHIAEEFGALAAGETLVIDPLFEYYNTGGNARWMNSDGSWHTQTFTPTTAHVITSVKLLLSRTGRPGTFYVDIKATDGAGKPTGSALASGTTNANTLPVYSSMEWREITLGSGYSLSAGTKYAIVVHSTTGNASNYYTWRVDGTWPTYFGGWALESLDGGSSWTNYTAYDNMFEEWGYEGPAVTTGATTSVELTTATVNGEVTSIGGTSITERGFVWDTVTRSNPGNVAPGSSDYVSNWTEGGSWGTGTFNHGLTSLTKGELYYVRAAAKNNDGNWGYGSEITFLTKPDAPNTLVATAGNKQVSLSWTKGTGADNTIIRGKIDGYPSNYDTDVDVYSGTDSSTTHTGLTNGDHWYYRAWSYTTDGGKEQYSDLYDQADATPVGVPDVATDSATDIGFTDATLNGEVTAIGDTTITDRGFVWGTTSYGDPGNVAPASTSYTSNWTENGTYGVGSFNYNATGLSEGGTYYFRAAAKNSNGWAYGGELSFQTVGLKLWFQPNTMINPANVPDRSGWGNTGTINWGTNPGGFEITIEGLKPFGSYVAPEQEEAPEIMLLPAELEMFEPEAPDLSHLPVYDLVHQYSESMGWTDQVGYGVLMLITAIAFGFGAMVATGSAIGFAIGFGITVAAAGGTGALPFWIAIICVLLAIFAAYAWRHT